MKLHSIILLAACVAAAGSTASKAVEDATKDFEKAKSGLAALDNFVKILSPDKFIAEPTPVILGSIGKAVSIVSSILGLFKKSPQTQSPQVIEEIQKMAQQIREQFLQVNNRLDRISLQLEEVKNLIEWRTTRGMYSDFEVFITASSHMLEKLIASPQDQFAIRRRQFITTFEKKRMAGLKLYQAIVETEFIISDNLAAAVVHYTQNHRSKVTSFLLAMTRLILKGAQLETAFEMLEHGEESAEITEADWRERMARLVAKVKQVDAQVANAWHGQMQRDTQRIIAERQGLSHGDLAKQLWNFLTEKYPWRHWFTLVYTATASHGIWHCGGAQFLNAPGNRHVVVASSDKVTSRFNKPRTDAVLTAVRNVGDHSFGNVVNEMHARLGLNCNDAAFKGVVHSDAGAHWAHSVGRLSHAAIQKSFQKIVRVGFVRIPIPIIYYLHALLFG